MIVILEKYKHNQDFHQIVDFVEASRIRIETTEEGTKILATVDGKLRTVSKSSIRRNLKLNDKAGISSLPDAELFENLTLMGYNISLNQKFTFQKGQFSRQWKYLIHTIMQCLSPKSTGFNEFSSNITTALVCLATNRVYNFSKMIFNGMVRNVHNKVSKFLMHYTRRARIAQSSALPPVADEPASPIRDDSQGEACPTGSGLKAYQDMANIPKTSTLPSDSTTRVTSLAADEGRLSYWRTEKKEALPNLEMMPPIKGRRLDEGEEAAERVSVDTEEMATVLTFMDAASVLTSGGVQVVPNAAEVANATVSIPTSSEVVSTASPTIPTASPIFTTAM
nr:synaptobrevin, longin-like domain protein [Tanacetum cinerariifolium]